MKIAIYGGSFNPVHVEHINLVKMAIDHFSLDKLIVVPSFMPPHRLNDQREDFSHRYNMLKLCFEGVEKVEVSNFEQLSGGVSYTFLTIERFKKQYPFDQLYFLVGTDMLFDFPSWYNPKGILENCQLIVTPREGDNLELAVKNFQSIFAVNPLISPHIGKNVSSTKLRTYLKLGLKTNLTIEPVLNYIKENNLYLGGEYYEFVKGKLPEKRLIHTANVIVKGISLAKQIGEDKQMVELACLLHDVAKYEKVDDYCDFTPPINVPDSVIHQFLGAHICKTVLKIPYDNVINAVCYHTTGRKNMSNLEKIVFIADLIEENRNFSGVDEIRKRIDENFETGFAFAVKELYKFLKNQNNKVYYLTKECAEFYNKGELL